MAETEVNTLIAQKGANLKKIYAYKKKYDSYRAEFDAINSDKTTTIAQKRELKIEVNERYDIDNMKEFLENLSNLEKANLLFYLGSLPTVRKLDNGKIKVVATLDYYLIYESNYIIPVMRKTNIFGKEIERKKLENEIDVHFLFEPLIKNDNDFIRAFLGKYVGGKIIAKDFKTWGELNSSIKEDIAERKNIFKHINDQSKDEESLAQQL